MANNTKWSKKVYEGSITSQAWWYTPFDGGKWSDVVAADDEIRGLVEMEMELDLIPGWAEEIAKVWIRYVPPCGHYRFPEPMLQVLDAIGSESVPPFRHSCYTVAGERKRNMMDYCFCLDAWLAGTTPEGAARELKAMGHRKIDWDQVCRQTWEVLGERAEWKDLLIERELIHLRLWIKFPFWDDDGGDRFCRDHYFGDMFIDDMGRPNYDLGASKRVKELTGKLAKVCPHWEWFSRVLFDEWWLCAPKAFRFLERDLWAIGKGRPWQKGEQIPGFLQVEDTYPSQKEAAEWWSPFCGVLDGWYKGKPENGSVAEDVNTRLGDPTPVKKWLARLYLRKLKMLEDNDEQFTRLVRADRKHKGGKRPLLRYVEDS